MFLGAGISIPSGIPGLKDIPSKLVEKARRYNIREVIDYVSSVPDLEKAFTLLQVLEVLDKFNLFDLVKLKKIKSLKHYKFVHDTLRRFLDQWLDELFRVEPNDIHNSIAEFIYSLFKNNIQIDISIVTTNYDCCLEKALLYRNIDINTYITERSNCKSCIKLIKIHGSINWYYCPHCLNVQEYDIRKIYDYICREHISILPRCKNDDYLMEKLVVLPYYFKPFQVPKIIDIWHKGKDVIANSNLILIVGYSFPDTDDYLRQIFKQSFMSNNTFVIVINPSETVRAEMEKFSEMIGLDFKNRYIYLQYSAEKIISDVLNIIFNYLLKKRKK